MADRDASATALASRAARHARAAGHTGVALHAAEAAQAEPRVAAPDPAILRLERHLVRSDASSGVLSASATVLDDGRVMAATDGAGMTMVWDVGSGEQPRMLPGRVSTEFSVGWVEPADGSGLLATCDGTGRTAQIWDGRIR
jgi:hypothetical protein